MDPIDGEKDLKDIYRSAKIQPSARHDELLRSQADMAARRRRREMASESIPKPYFSLRFAIPSALAVGVVLGVAVMFSLSGLRDESLSDVTQMTAQQDAIPADQYGMPSTGYQAGSGVSKGGMKFWESSPKESQKAEIIRMIEDDKLGEAMDLLNTYKVLHKDEEKEKEDKNESLPLK